jgi:type II secretory pathway pseudopilin PulG
MKRVGERGASGLLILVILIFIIVGFLAIAALKRVTSSGDERNETQRRLAAGAAALEQFAASNARLPCPANPAVNDGVEVQAGAATCTYPEGTVPWKTLAMKYEDAFDAWERKISYRVYTGNAGSLTQAGGVSMVECDLNDPGSGNTTASAGGLGGLCVSDADPYKRSTTSTKFLAGKGLTLNDVGTAHGDVAYVLISHGSTGLGAYTVSGARLDLPAGDERDNTKENGSFTIKAFSEPDVEATSNQHFDDLLVYRTLPDLVKRIGLEAREWPDLTTSSVTFDNATVAAAAGHAVTPGDIGAATLDFGSARVSGYSGGSTATNLSFDTAGSTEGVGVAGNPSNLLSNHSDEWLKIELAQGASKFAVTLNDFGTYDYGGKTYTEQVQFSFFLAGAAVGSPVVKAGCRADGGLASYSMTPAGTFDSVEVRPLWATSPPSDQYYTGLLVSEVVACASSVANCKTGLSSGANDCP